MKSLLALLLLAGCGAGACRQITLVQPNVPAQVIVHTVYVPETTPHAGVLKTYDATVSKQKAIASHGSIPAIWALTGLSTNARKALEPLQRSRHHATPDEVKHAVDAVDALKEFVDAPHAVVPPQKIIKLTVPK